MEPVFVGLLHILHTESPYRSNCAAHQDEVPDQGTALRCIEMFSTLHSESAQETSQFQHSPNASFGSLQKCCLVLQGILFPLGARRRVNSICIRLLVLLEDLE